MPQNLLARIVISPFFFFFFGFCFCFVVVVVVFFFVSFPYPASWILNASNSKCACRFQMEKQDEQCYLIEEADNSFVVIFVFFGKFLSTQLQMHKPQRAKQYVTVNLFEFRGDVRENQNILYYNNILRWILTCLKKYYICNTRRLRRKPYHLKTF